MGWEGFDDILNGAVMAHLSEKIVLNPDQPTQRNVSALVDIEGVNAEAIGGSIGGVIGKAQLLLNDLDGLEKGGVISYLGERYKVVAHPRKIDNSMCELELGVIGEQSVPDIRY
jgi:hypothetical protein